MFASRALKNKGYKVYEANSGEAALAVFKKIENELDLLISDVVMPIMDGPRMVRPWCGKFAKPIPSSR